MDYNSNREKLILPEYGRNIQNMVNHCIAIEDKEERNRAARAIIDVMGNMYPYLRDIPDFRHKLWDHLAIMSDFKLDIDSPYELPSQEKLQEPPKKVPYSNGRIKYRHYGRTMELLIDKAVEYEEGDEKKILIALLANHMKKCYLVWNKDAVEDDKIVLDMEELSKGAIQMKDEYTLSESKTLLYRKNNNNNNNNNNKRRYNNNQKGYFKKK
ncbi:DUF4290 domain-containing protein [Prolixibacteraceae bacterium JC049]|nr:DUF4290 domain-containing protein [Prolixibacteraceae bacterium JC049]